MVSDAHIKNDVNHKERVQRCGSDNSGSKFKMLSLDVTFSSTKVLLIDVLKLIGFNADDDLFDPPIPYPRIRIIIKNKASSYLFGVGR